METKNLPLYTTAFLLALAEERRQKGPVSLQKS